MKQKLFWASIGKYNYNFLQVIFLTDMENTRINEWVNEKLSFWTKILRFRNTLARTKCLIPWQIYCYFLGDMKIQRNVLSFCLKVGLSVPSKLSNPNLIMSHISKPITWKKMFCRKDSLDKISLYRVITGSNSTLTFWLALEDYIAYQTS